MDNVNITITIILIFLAFLASEATLKSLLVKFLNKIFNENIKL